MEVYFLFYPRTQFDDDGDGEPYGGDEEDGGEDPLGGLRRGLEGEQDVGCTQVTINQTEPSKIILKFVWSISIC